MVPANDVGDSMFRGLRIVSDGTTRDKAHISQRKGGITDATVFAASPPARFARSSWTAHAAACTAGARGLGAMTKWEARDMPKSSSLADGAKTYYRPIGAAIRWSGIAALRAAHPGDIGTAASPEPTEFPRWPTLRLNAERIFDALAHGEMPYGKEGLGAGHAGPGDGRPVADGAARRSESLDGALLPRRETGVSVR